MDEPDDDWYDPRDELPPQEEPDCYQCNDGAVISAGWLGRLFGRTSIGCPSCNPDRITRLYQRSRLWKVRGWLWLLRHPRGPVGGEAPF